MLLSRATATAGALRTRAPRPKSSTFVPTELAKSLTKLAEKRKVVFKWDATDYPSLARSLPPSVNGLEMFYDPLRIILSFATTGFPAHAALRDVLLQLHDEHHIFGVVPPHRIFKVATEAADHWRILTRHLYTLKKNCTDLAGHSEKVAELVSMIVLPDTGLSSTEALPDEPTPALAAVEPPAPLSDAALLGLFPQDICGGGIDDMSATEGGDDEVGDEEIEVDSESESDIVEEVGFVCQCAECRPSMSDVTVTPAAASALQWPPATEGTKPAIPAPKRGGQKAETARASPMQPKSKIRIRAKTAPDAVLHKSMQPKAKAKQQGKLGLLKYCSGVLSGSMRAPLEGPVKLVRRFSKLNKGVVAECYLLCGGKYLAGQSMIVSKNCENNMMKLKQEVESKVVNTKLDAMMWLRNQPA